MPNLLVRQENLMKTVRNTLNTLSILAIVTFAQAQIDPMTGMSLDQMMMQQQQWQMQMTQFDQQMNQWTQQQMQQAQMQLDQESAKLRQFFIDYYRQQTGDYSTPDQEAVMLGDRLYCQNQPVECQQFIQHYQSMSQISAANHQQNMANIQSWGQTQNQIGQTYSDILDMSHQGYMDRSASNSQSQAGYVQGAIYGEANYYSSNGSAYSLPIYPDHTMSYTTPEGYPLYFDYGSNTWYQLDSYGFSTPLEQR